MMQKLEEIEGLESVSLVSHDVEVTFKEGVAKWSK